jgi:hypothetical protein
MKIIYFFLFSWVIFALPDPDPATPINVDPCGSGPTTLAEGHVRVPGPPLRHQAGAFRARRGSGGGGGASQRLLQVLPESLSLKKISVANPEPGSGAFLTPGSGIRCLFDPWIRDPVPF